MHQIVHQFSKHGFLSKNQINLLAKHFIGQEEKSKCLAHVPEHSSDKPGLYREVGLKHTKLKLKPKEEKILISAIRKATDMGWLEKIEHPHYSASGKPTQYYKMRQFWVKRIKKRNGLNI